MPAPILGIHGARRRGRVAEGDGLLNRYTLSRCIEGSNPSVSANTQIKSTGRTFCERTHLQGSLFGDAFWNGWSLAGCLRGRPRKISPERHSVFSLASEGQPTRFSLMVKGSGFDEVALIDFNFLFVVFRQQHVDRGNDEECEERADGEARRDDKAEAVA